MGDRTKFKIGIYGPNDGDYQLNRLVVHFLVNCAPIVDFSDVLTSLLTCDYTEPYSCGFDDLLYQIVKRQFDKVDEGVDL